MAKPPSNLMYVAIGVVILAVFVFAIKMMAAPGLLVQGQTPDPQVGSTNPQVTIVEYGDFQCPACKKMEPNIKQAVTEFGDKIALQFNDYPLTSLHPNAYAASEAAQCAFKVSDDSFWKMHDVLYETQDDWSALRDPNATFIGYAQELGLDVESFTSCLNNHDTKASIDEDVAEANSQKIDSTPTLFVGGERYVGTGSYDSLRRLIIKHLPAETTNNANANAVAPN